MIALVANKLFMRSKFKKALLANFDLMKKLQSGDWIIVRNFDLMKTGKII
jgi:hypothetical protein